MKGRRVVSFVTLIELFAGLAGLVAVPTMASAKSSEAVCVSEFSAGMSDDSFEIAPGPDGNLWFTERPGKRIGRITPDGRVTEFLQGISSNPESITAGPDGNIWFTESFVNRIGRITPTGQVTEFSQGISSNPQSITAGPDGNLWFTESFVNRIGRITPTGQVTEFSTGLPDYFGVDFITSGPDGNLWFIASTMPVNLPPPNPTRTLEVGRITPSGQVTEFSQGISPMANDGSDGITAGPDGNLWYDGGALGRITPSGQVTEFGPPIGDGAIVAGPDGNLWAASGISATSLPVARIALSGSCPPLQIPLRRVTASQSGATSLTLHCGTGRPSCGGTVSLTVRVRDGHARVRTVTVAEANYSIPPRSTTTVALRLNATGRKLLATTRDHRLDATASAAGTRRQVILVLAASTRS